MGVGATAAMNLLAIETNGAVTAESESSSRFRLHHAPRAKRVIQISLIGGLSHLDSLDHKPELAKYHGKPLPSSETPDIFFGQVGLLRQSDWEFRQRGQSGLWLSDMFPKIAEHADELCVIRSLTADSANHTPALYVENSGFQFGGFPSVGSWVSFGLGAETEDLPTYVVLPDTRGLPNGGASIWSNGFLPGEHQGVVFRGGDQPVRDLFPPRSISAENDRDTLAFLSELNRRRDEQTPEEQSLLARIKSYELAARMQLSVPDTVDLSGESQTTIEAYGLNSPTTKDFGRNCLVARRLIEKGVRFVQLFSGGPIAGSPRISWDAHENVKENHSLEAERIDQPIAALLGDLRQRGLLEDTLVLFTTEFGRTPFAQSAAGTVGPGRDHNKYGFSVWMAGAGLKKGIAYGSTDPIGWKATENPATWHDFHATVLHLLGLDHERLTYYHNGIQRRLTNVHGAAIREVLA